MGDQLPGRIMVARRQLWNSDALSHEHNLGEGARQLHNELCRRVAISGKPVDHPGVGVMSVGLPRRPVRIGFPVGVGETAGVLVVRIALVGVLERRLRKGEAQNSRCSKVEASAHGSLILAQLALWMAPRGAERAQRCSSEIIRRALRLPVHIRHDRNAFRLAPEERGAGTRLRAGHVRQIAELGLVIGSGTKAEVSITKLGQDIVAPSAPTQRAEGLLAALRTVKDFENVEKFYGGKRIPEDEFFLNTVVREFSIPRDRVEAFAKVFRDNLNYLRSFSGSSTSAEERPASESDLQATPAEKVPRPTLSKEPRIREFLDTCFVMMPFGSWFDRYYQEIYAPAIKEAGFEPVQADELFTTGSVVEQIWEQIEKAALLLADLSGKNPNVFYELGLAHAARKPVVFTAAQVEDGPFDLRHLRVIIYDVREPEWAARLKKSVTDYLRNAVKDSGKSMPHPFRKQLEVRESVRPKPTRRA